MKSTSLVAAKLEVARTRDRLAQEKRRWPRALHAPPSAAAPPSDLAESPPRESTTGPAAASVAPTIAAPPPADRRPAPSSRFRRAHIALDLKYDGSWRGNDKRYFTGRDAEVLPYPLPHRRRDMPPEPLRHSAPNGPEHASVDFAAGLPSDESPNPERSPPVKPCGHRSPYNCSVLRARLRVPEPPAPMAVLCVDTTASTPSTLR